MKKNKNILRYVEVEARKDKPFAVGSKSLLIIKVLYCVASVYAIMMSMVVMFGNMFTMMEYAGKENASEVAKYNQERMYLITLLIAIGVMIAAYVLLKLKLAIPFGAAVCVNCIIIFTVFLKPSLQNDIKNGGQMGFWGPFGIPAILCALLALFIMAMHLLDGYRINQAYESLTAKLYNKATENGEKSIDYDDFDAYLDAYRGEEIFDESKPLKKSMKVRKQKQDYALREQKASEDE